MPLKPSSVFSWAKTRPMPAYMFPNRSRFLTHIHAHRICDIAFQLITVGWIYLPCCKVRVGCKRAFAVIFGSTHSAMTPARKLHPPCQAQASRQRREQRPDNGEPQTADSCLLKHLARDRKDANEACEGR